jgi:hypothetical protein
MYRTFLIASFLISFNLAYGHGAVQRASELTDSDIRLFVADNMDGSVVTIDFPDGKIINRVSTPPSIMILALSRNKQYIYAMRGRDTDQDVVSIITAHRCHFIVSGTSWGIGRNGPNDMRLPELIMFWIKSGGYNADNVLVGIPSPHRINVLFVSA